MCWCFSHQLSSSPDTSHISPHPRRLLAYFFAICDAIPCCRGTAITLGRVELFPAIVFWSFSTNYWVWITPVTTAATRWITRKRPAKARNTNAKSVARPATSKECLSPVVRLMNQSLDSNNDHSYSPSERRRCRLSKFVDGSRRGPDEKQSHHQAGCQKRCERVCQ